MDIERDILIEDLVERWPGAVKILLEHELVCVICGEPVWGTLDELASTKGIDSTSLDKIVDDLNKKLK